MRLEANAFTHRECVGMHFARATLWVVVATMLSVFDFSKAKDEHGNEIEISDEVTSGLVRFVAVYCAFFPS